MLHYFKGLTIDLKSYLSQTDSSNSIVQLREDTFVIGFPKALTGFLVFVLTSFHI